MDLSDRFKKLIEENGITPYTIALKTGIAQSTISRLLKGQTAKPNIKNIETLAEYFHTTPTWLLTGEGEMLKGANLNTVKLKRLTQTI